MTITAKIILDSTSAQARITTMELVYPRFIHAEMLTHRVFSKNSASSRAIPMTRMLDMIRSDPAMPVHWGANQAGMQAHAEIADQAAARQAWLAACESACQHSEQLAALGLHKQICNRITEPFMHIKVLVTATDWDNFFMLRDHAAAQPEIAVLARCMKSAMSASTPTVLDTGSWHIPYIQPHETSLDTLQKLRLSVARCARVSYQHPGGLASTHEQDLALHDRLAGSQPKHLSPFEHQSQSLGDKQRWVKNFRGWRQFRDIVEYHDTDNYDFDV